MRIKKFLFLFLFVFITFSCKRSNNPVSPNNEQMTFPMKTGSTWEYEITDTTFYSLRDSMQTNNGILKVKILNTTILGNGKKAFIWQYNFQNTFDSLYVLSSGDSIIFYQDKQYPYAKTILVFPLSVNNEWKFTECDKYKVLSKDTLNLQVIGKITDVVKVQQNFTCEGEAGLTNDYYINSNIGIVKYKSNYFNAHYSFSKHERWVLKSYSINQ